MIKLSDLILERNNQPKAVIMAGGAGAGKSFLLQQLNLKSLPQYNPDKYVEDPGHPYSGNLSAASAQTTKDVELASDKGQSFVWDTTASNKGKVQELLDKGYSVFMVMVYTHPMISFISNFSRERRIPKIAVFSTWTGVYSLIDDYRQMLGDNFSIFVNTRDGKYDKEVDGFNKAAKNGAKGVEEYLRKYIDANGGDEAFSSTFRKEFNLSSELETNFQKVLKQSTVPTDDEGILKALRKDFEKYAHHYESGKYGKDRLENLYQKQLATREKLRSNEETTLGQIADMIVNPTFQELLKSASASEIDSKIQKFL